MVLLYTLIRMKSHKKTVPLTPIQLTLHRSSRLYGPIIRFGALI